jgi:hypothetical protein
MILQLFPGYENHVVWQHGVRWAGIGGRNEIVCWRGMPPEQQVTTKKIDAEILLCGLWIM